MPTNTSHVPPSLRSAGIVMALLLVSLAGCGGGSSSPSAPQLEPTPAWAPLTITVPPARAMVAAGAAATFEVALSGNPPYSYQWSYNGQSIPRATQATYVMNNVQPNDSGAVIRVEVQDRSGAKVTGLATLEVVGTGIRPFVGAVPYSTSFSRAIGALPFEGIPDPGDPNSGYGQEARFRSPILLDTDGAGILYAADNQMYNVRKITPAGRVSILAGPVLGIPGDQDGPGVDARFGHLSDIAVTKGGTVYVQDRDTIRKITAAGIVSTLVLPSDPLNFNEYRQTGEEKLVGLAADASANLYYAIETEMRVPCYAEYRAQYPDCTLTELTRFTIRKLDTSGVVSTVVSSESIYRDLKIRPFWSLMRQSTFQVDTDGTLYIVTAADSGFSRPVVILAVSPAGIARKLSGSLQAVGNLDGDAGTATFRSAYDLTIDSEHNLYVLDCLWSCSSRSIRKITPDGRVTTLAGDGAMGAMIFSALPGQLNWVSGMTVGEDGTFYVGAIYGIIKVIPALH
jgi:hypothetical protein